MLATEVVRVSEEIALPFCLPDAPRKEQTEAGCLAFASSRIRLTYIDLPTERNLRKMCHELGRRYDQWRNIPLSRKKQGYASLEIAALRLGDITLVSLPGEVMLEIGQQVEAGLGGNVLVLGYTNGNPGYLCTARSYDEGGYEPTCFLRTYLHPAAFTPETEEILVRTGIRTAKKVAVTSAAKR